jgi:dihydroxyacetone kinase
VTSLDMAGCSLTLAWLDHGLEGFWTAPADSAAFRRGPDIPAEPAAQECLANEEAPKIPPARPIRARSASASRRC